MEEKLEADTNNEEDKQVVEAEEEKLEEQPSKKEKKKYVRLRYRTSENDIKYRGPITYRGLRIVAWITIILAQLGVIFNIASKLFPDNTVYPQAHDFFSVFNGFSVSIFLVANFAYILLHRNKFKKILLFYGGMSVAMYVAAVFVTSHFGYEVLHAIDPEMSFWTFSQLLGSILISVGNSSAYLFNIFIDLFLCTLVFFFLHYEPKKHFKGKSIIFFRLLVILPILYELGSIFIKYHVITERTIINSFLFFLLTAKPPFSFIAFVIIVGVMKLQSMNYYKKYKSKELLNEYMNSKAYSLRVSILMAWSFLLCVILDFLSIVIYGAYYFVSKGAEDPSVMIEGMAQAQQMGFGNSVILIFFIPVLFLFSFNKRPARPKVDTFLPLVAIGFIILMYVEGLFQIGLAKIPELRDAFTELFNQEKEAASSFIPLKEIVSFIRIGISSFL